MLIFFLSLFLYADADPHEHNHRLQNRHAKKFTSNLSTLPNLAFTPSELTDTWNKVTVSWSDIGFGGKNDWIGVYADVEGKSQETWGSVVEFRIICEDLVCSRGAPESGNITFTLINRRQPYRFVYFGGEAPYAEFKAISGPLSFTNPEVPMNVHTAVASATSMYVMWVQKSVGSKPAVYWGTSRNSLKRTTDASSDNHRTFDRSDLCDRNGPGAPASTIGYYNLGNMLIAELTGLEPDTVYFYRTGEPSSGYSPTFHFTSPPKPGSPVKFIAFGDMGGAPLDGSYEQSWDNHNKGELGALKTIDSISNLIDTEDQPRFLLHFGDISYATGYMSEWDEFINEIEPIAAHMPYMTGIGNHEMGVTSSFEQSTDSGGECGVPYNFYFPYASQSMKDPWHEMRPWYRFNYGMVCVFQLSSEHDISTDSSQLNWLVNELNDNVNRTETPWVIFTIHRPMYVDSDWKGDMDMSLWLQEYVEPLMMTHKVNLGLYGHYHAYQRTCPVNKGSNVEDGNAPVHFVLGMAGYELTRNTPIQPKPWAVHRDQKHFGYAILNAKSSSELQIDFINAEDDSVIDSLTVENYALEKITQKKSKRVVK